MLYTEFLEATGGANTEKNRDLFRHVEAIYMATDMTKEEAYRMVKHHVDTQTDEQKKLAADIRMQIEKREADIQFLKDDIVHRRELLRYETDTDMCKFWRNDIKATRELIKRTRTEIARLKWVISE